MVEGGCWGSPRGSHPTPWDHLQHPALGSSCTGPNSTLALASQVWEREARGSEDLVECPDGGTAEAGAVGATPPGQGWSPSTAQVRVTRSACGSRPSRTSCRLSSCAGREGSRSEGTRPALLCPETPAGQHCKGHRLAHRSRGSALVQASQSLQRPPTTTGGCGARGTRSPGWRGPMSGWRAESRPPPR